MKRDLKYKTFIWTQFPNKLMRSSLMKITNGLIESQESDEGADNDADEDEDIVGKFTYQPIKMILNERDFIYYVTKKNGLCYIVEGNPRDQKIDNHEIIYSIKAEKCLALTIDGEDTFYFMDESYVVQKLNRNSNNRMLSMEKELTMKEI